ncbi:sugar kinase, ribokinase [Schinkia azotoformans MEV2011]|uniref:Sugar kinase, ribokinase n=1 Tax=Schinkia azotoformans MEV2011 TaxID=1348973 RepID=A0A072NRJ2_SCHAZ|nr:sugar kinase [Schinkia azotoformans]KEF35825.1 sugar kinase, ribokinase [Schinkia azotoformans MEV2011]
MLDILTIGDALVSFNPSTTGPLRFVNTFERKVGGAELNVAIGCSRLGLKAGWISRLGKDEFGKYVYNFVRGEGVDVSQVKLVEGYPTSIYFKELLSSEKVNSYYYRQQSPTLSFNINEIDEDYVKQAKIFHISGVFPAVNDVNKEVMLHLLKMAKKHNLTVTLDPNIRLKLWSPEEARETLLSYLPYVDVLLIGEEEAEILLRTSEPDQFIQEVTKAGIHHAVLKQGERGATAFKDGDKVNVPAHHDIDVVDVIGAGDGFAAGYLYSMIQGWTLEKSVTFANAVAAHVISVKGDNEGLPYKEEMEIFLGKRKGISR